MSRRFPAGVILTVAVRGDIEDRGKVVRYPVEWARGSWRAAKVLSAGPGGARKKDGYFDIFKVQHASQTAWSAISVMCTATLEETAG